MSDPNAGKVVSLTNISSEDFTHSWGGVPYFVKAGDTLMFPYHLAHHLAKHLARKILIAGDKGAIVYDPSDTTSKNGLGTPLWNEVSEKELVGKILGEEFSQELPGKKSEMELLKEQVAELNKFKGDFAKKEPDAPELKPSELDGYKDKSEVIEELKAKGVAVDARKSKADLEKLLNE